MTTSIGHTPTTIAKADTAALQAGLDKAKQAAGRWNPAAMPYILTPDVLKCLRKRVWYFRKGRLVSEIRHAGTT